MKKSLHVFLVLLLVLSVVAGCSSPAPAPAPAPEAKVLKIGSDIAYKPFEFFDDKQVATGFDVELMKALAEDNGYKAEFETAAFDGLIPALQAKKYDAVISAMTIREDRAKVVLFSDPYFKAEQYICFIEGKNNFAKAEDLKGKKIGVQLNTTGQFAIEALGFQTQKYDIIPDAFNAMLSGGLDAVVADNQPVLEFIKANKATTIKYVPANAGDEFYGIALNQENKELAGKFNASLKKFKENGKYAEIYKKWFEGEVPKF